MLLESDVSPFLKRGSDHLRFPVFTLNRRRLEHVCESINAVYQDVSLQSWEVCSTRIKKGRVQKLDSDLENCLSLSEGEIPDKEDFP